MLLGMPGRNMHMNLQIFPPKIMNRWVNILGTIAHKNNPLESRGERPQIMFIEKKHLKNTLDISRKWANLHIIWWYVVFYKSSGPLSNCISRFLGSFLFFIDFVQDTRAERVEWSANIERYLMTIEESIRQLLCKTSLKRS